MTSTELPIFTSLLIAAVLHQEPPRLRRTLPNGAKVLVERVAGAKSISISIWANAQNCPETLKTNGRRHLLEHLMARGNQLNVDGLIESAGGLISARTQRETMEVSISIPKDKLALGLRVLQDILSVPRVTPERIKVEAKIIREELALEESPTKLANDAWRALPNPVLSPSGDYDVIAETTPEELVKTYKAQFSSPNLVLAVAGDFDAERTLSEVMPIMAVMPDRGEFPSVKESVPHSISFDAKGLALASPVGSFALPSTAATLAAGLALADEVENSFAIYTPSNQTSLIIIGTQSEPEKLQKLAEKSVPALLFPRAKYLLKAWILGQLESPEGMTSLRGQLLCLGKDLRPETMIENINALTLQEFQLALRRFAPGTAIMVGSK